jgi:CRISPR-associated protein Cmr3
MRALPVCGPFLVELTAEDAPPQLLLPAPGDALPFAGAADHTLRRRWLRPVLIDTAAQSDLDPRLFTIGMAAPVAEKPLAKPPAFWRQKSYLDWLTAPQDDAGDVAVDAIGIPGLVAESRVHVRIDPATGTADEGFLFQTSGLEFQRRPQTKPAWRLGGTTTLALLVVTDAEIDAGPGSLGGERRTVFWQRAADRLPACPPTLQAAIVDAQACRLILTTPGIFADGLLPRLDWLAIPGLKVTVKGAVASRYDVISGWDYAAGMAKATRRLAPAGAVYYLSLAGSSDAAIDQFVARVWFHPVSDDAQDRRDGFGVAALGVWDGKQVQMEVKPCHKNR